MVLFSFISWLLLQILVTKTLNRLSTCLKTILNIFLVDKSALFKNAEKIAGTQTL